jgi:hypothetical protein
MPVRLGPTPARSARTLMQLYRSNKRAFGYERDLEVTLSGSAVSRFLMTVLR